MLLNTVYLVVLQAPAGSTMPTDERDGVTKANLNTPGSFNPQNSDGKFVGASIPQLFS